MLATMLSSFIVVDAAAPPAPLGSPPGHKTPFEKYGKLQLLTIDGYKQLCDSKGNPVQLKGMNTYGLQWAAAQWLDNNPEGWDGLAYDWKIELLRLAMYVGEGGYGFTNATIGNYNTNAPRILQRVEEYLQEATARGMYVIVDWHCLTPGNPTHANYLGSGINPGVLPNMPALFQQIYADNPTWNGPQVFFAYIAAKYGAQGNVFYDPSNEPNGMGGNHVTAWNNTLKAYFTEDIDAIRVYDEDGIVLIGTPNWSQITNVAVGNPLDDQNVMFAFHFYSGTHDVNDNWMKDMVVDAINHGFAVMAAEWGASLASGTGGPFITEGNVWHAFLDKWNISSAAWHLGRASELSGAFFAGAAGVNPTYNEELGYYAWKDSELKPAGQYYRSITQSQYAKVNAPKVYISGTPVLASGAGDTASYVIGFENMKVSGIELVFEIDGDFLGGNSYYSDNFTFLNAGSFGTPIFWIQDGNKWIGKALLINADGVCYDAEILNLLFNAVEGVIGTTDVVLKSIHLSYEGKTVYKSSDGVDAASFTTTFVKWFSRYDLNKDGVIDIHDITFALQYLGAKEGDADWDEAKVADVEEDGVIDINDLLLILANYTVPYYG